MIFGRLGLIHKDQRGFTLIELLVALAITGAIAGGIVTAIFQIFTVNTQSNEHMLAIRQVQNAGDWISHDTQMAQSIDADPVIIGGGEDPHPLFELYPGQTQVLALTWVGWERIEGQGGSEKLCIDTYELLYTYDDTNNKLWRHQRITTKKYDTTTAVLMETTYSPGPEADDWSTTFVAGYIYLPLEDIGGVDMYIVGEMDGDKLVVTIPATVGDATEERTYEITPRPGS